MGEGRVGKEGGSGRWTGVGGMRLVSKVTCAKSLQADLASAECLGQAQGQSYSQGGFSAPLQPTCTTILQLNRAEEAVS